MAHSHSYLTPEVCMYCHDNLSFGFLGGGIAGGRYSGFTGRNLCKEFVHIHFVIFAA